MNDVAADANAAGLLDFVPGHRKHGAAVDGARREDVGFVVGVGAGL